MKWEAIRDGRDRRRVSYWRLASDPSKRTAALGAVAQDLHGAHAARWLRSRANE